MFSSRKAVFDAEDIPSVWIFEHYLKLDVKLIGQNYKLKSVFNVNDNDPSMYLYVRGGSYRFKCFSTGKEGNGYDLVMLLYNCDFANAFSKVKSDYLNTSAHAPSEQIIAESKWVVSDYRIRDKWNKTDAAYWSPYNIGSKILEKFNVRPLESYTMSKDDASFTVAKSKIYGYFTQGGELCKIYTPEEENKFMTIKSTIQGWDQVTSNTNRVFICSSLKDIMSLYSLGIEGNIIAPPSENSRIDQVKDWVALHKEKYTIFDNDPAGIKAMQTYDELYKIPYLVLPLSKDISDSVKDHGARKVKAVLLSMLEK
jgi:DNA primase